MRYFVQLSYKGTNYHGWQIQANAITIQEILQQKISILLKNNTEVIGAGRTDTGVHAIFYIAHFDTQHEINTDELTYILNKIIPQDIAIQQIYRVKDDAHSRFSALSRTYTYTITTKKSPFTLDTETYMWGDISIDMMDKACTVLKQYNDFTSFSKLHTDTHTNNCTIMDAHWEKIADKLIFTITANRFLRNMVRAIVGTMLEAGRGKISIEQFRTIIESKDRSNAGVSLPPQGLCLCNIEYPSGLVY